MVQQTKLEIFGDRSKARMMDEIKRKPAYIGEMKTPRLVDDFPKKGNHFGDLIRLPSGQVYEWIGSKGYFARWSRNYSRENG